MKKTLIIILAIILLLLPTIAALVLQLLPEGVVQTPITVSGTLYDGKLSYEFDRSNNSFLASFFSSLEQRSHKSELSEKDIEFLAGDKGDFYTMEPEDFMIIFPDEIHIMRKAVR